MTGDVLGEGKSGGLEFVGCRERESWCRQGRATSSKRGSLTLISRKKRRKLLTIASYTMPLQTVSVSNDGRADEDAQQFRFSNAGPAGLCHGQAPRDEL